MKARAGETIEITGTTMVEGVPVEVTLVINTVQLIHKLGAKAAYNKGRRASVAWSFVKATADKGGNLLVRAKVDEARQARKAREDARRAEWLASRPAT